jgi:hypothetical protein
MKEGLLIGGSVVVAGIFVGLVVYKIAKKNPKLLKNTRKKISKVGKKTSAIASEATRAFAEGFKGAQSKAATA